MRITLKTALLAAALLPGGVAFAGCDEAGGILVEAEAITLALQSPGRTEVQVEFAAGSVELTRNGLAQVQELAALLRDQPDLQLTLQIVARPEAGAAISVEREHVLARELARLDVPARQYRVRSHGPAELAAFQAKKSGGS